MFETREHSSCLLSFCIICVRNLHCANPGRRGEESKLPSLDLHITTLQMPFSSRHLLGCFVPDQGKAEGDTPESSATYAELQWVELQVISRSQSWLVMGFIPTMDSCLQLSACVGRGSPSHEMFYWGEYIKSGAARNSSGHRAELGTIWPLPFPSQISDDLWASSAVLWGQGLYRVVAIGHLDACAYHWL